MSEMISVNCDLQQSETGYTRIPLALDHAWRIGDTVQLVDAGRPYVVVEWCWHHWRPRSHDAYVKLNYAPDYA